MTILSMPTGLKPSSATWALVTNTQVWTSPFTRQVQVKELPGTQWAATYTFPVSKRADRAALEAFMMQLRGASGRFYAYNPQNQGLMGAGGGTPKVAGPGQVGSSINTDGWPVDTLVMKVGDEFQVGNELKRLVQDANSDAGGNALLVFEPPIRTSPVDNADIITDAPKCVMRLADDNQVSITEGADGFASISFSAVEVF